MHAPRSTLLHDVRECAARKFKGVPCPGVKLIKLIPCPGVQLKKNTLS